MSRIRKTKGVVDQGPLPLPIGKAEGGRRAKGGTLPDSKNGQHWATPSISRFSGTVDAATAQAVVYGLSGSITSLERLLSQPGTRADLLTALSTRLEKVARDLAQATTPGVGAALDEAHQQLLLDSVRSLDALAERLGTEAGGLPVRSQPTVDRIRETCGAFVGSKHEATAILLDVAATTASGLFDGPLPSKGSAIVYVDSDVPPRIVELLAERVGPSGQDLTVSNVTTGGRSRIWGMAGRALTDDPAWAKATGQVALFETLVVDQLGSQLDKLDALGVKRCHFLHTGPVSRELVAALGALVDHLPKVAFEITDAEGKTLAKLDPSTRELTVAAPANFTPELHQAYRGLLRRFLYGTGAERVRIPSFGELVKTATGVELKAQSTNVGQIKDLLLEQVEHRVATSLGAKTPDDPIARQVRTLFDAALGHAEQSAGHEHAELLNLQTWRSVATSIARFATTPSQASRLKDVLQRIVEHSEHPVLPGFGNGKFRGVALGANSAALMHLFNAQADAPGLWSAMGQIPSVLGPQSNEVVVHGAGVGIIVAKSLGEQARRLLMGEQTAALSDPGLRAALEEARARGLSSTDEHNAILRLVEEAIRSAKANQGRFVISTIPTDPTLGKAKTPTPDFVVEQRQAGQSRAVFLDAKSIDARHFDERYLTHIGTAVHQVLGHQFNLDERQDGWPWLRLYRADLSPSAKAGYFELIRRGLAQGFSERPRSTDPNELKAVVVLDTGPSQEVYLVPLRGEPTRLHRSLFEPLTEQRRNDGPAGS